MTKIGNWLSIKNHYPQQKTFVLCFGLNRQGEERYVVAQYIPPKTVLESDFTALSSEHDEENNCNWVESGWWEFSEESGVSYKLFFDITHWQPLSAPITGNINEKEWPVT